MEKHAIRLRKRNSEQWAKASHGSKIFHTFFPEWNTRTHIHTHTHTNRECSLPDQIYLPLSYLFCMQTVWWTHVPAFKIDEKKIKMVLNFCFGCCCFLVKKMNVKCVKYTETVLDGRLKIHWNCIIRMSCIHSALVTRILGTVHYRMFNIVDCVCCVYTNE